MADDDERWMRAALDAATEALDAADRIAGFQRRTATLYTTLEPCIMCFGAVMTTMVGRMVYALPSLNDGAANAHRGPNVSGHRHGEGG